MRGLGLSLSYGEDLCNSLSRRLPLLGEMGESAMQGEMSTTEPDSGSGQKTTTRFFFRLTFPLAIPRLYLELSWSSICWFWLPALISWSNFWSVDNRFVTTGRFVSIWSWTFGCCYKTVVLCLRIEIPNCSISAISVWISENSLCWRISVLV